VEVLVAAPRPSCRIVHLRDWHYVPPDLFALDARQAAGRALSDAEVEALYREHLVEIELVSLEQIGLLRGLVRHHGLRSVLAEGLTPGGLPAYRDVLAALRDTDRRLAELQKGRAGARAEAPDIDRGIAELVRGHRRQMLEHGAAGQLAVAGEVEVLPLDDEAALARAKPVGPDGKARADPAAVEARHDAQVRAALASGPCAFIILGGAMTCPPASGASAAGRPSISA
jgi:hypothetical protein